MAAGLLFGCATDRRREEEPARSLVVLLQPLGEVSARHLDSVDIALRREHGVEVLRAAPVPLPKHAFVNVRAPRYRADSLIAWLRSIKPDTVDRIMGLTTVDISATKRDQTGAIKAPSWKYTDFGIFGLARVGGASCVISTYRLGDADHPKFHDRLMKISVHELGHTRSLPHCTDLACVMRDAVERMASVDGCGRALCPACRSRLAH